MKWRRGLLRLWIGLSVLWIVAVGAATWATTDSWWPYQPDRTADRIEHIKSGAEVALIPPVIILVAGAALAWAIGRFRAT
jgi:hypothetical protein